MQKKLNIYFIIATMEKGGAQTVAFTLYKELSKFYNVKFVVYNKKNIQYDIDQSNIRELNINQGVTSFLKKIILVRKFLSTLNNEDVVISFMGNMNLLIAISNLMNINKSKIILTEHTIFTKGVSVGLRLKNFIRSKLYKPYPIVVVSKGLEDSFKKLISNQLNIQTIYNPIDFDKIKQLSLEKINEENFFLFVGRLEKVKNIDTIIKAYSLLDANIKKEYKLLIIGDGSQRQYLEELAKDEKNIIFKGNQNNPYKYMRNARVLILMSKWEGFGLVLVEALISGVGYIVSSDCDYGPREILLNDKVGSLIENDTSILKEYLNKIIIDNIKSDKLESERVLTKFNSRNIIEKYRSLIEN